jgi:hypothetical protein
VQRVKQPLLFEAGCHARPSKYKFKKMCDKRPLLSVKGCHTELDGQHCPLRPYHGIFFKGGKPSEDMNSHLFLMNKKGLSVLDPLHTQSSLRESQLKIRLKKIFLGWIIEHSGENIWWRLWVRRMLFSCKISLLQKGRENSVY